jgi:pimeloyl-ACP methyl ester carboxylesterase
MPDGEQAQRSKHHWTFLEPNAGPLLLANDARRLRERLAKSGVPAAAIEQYLSVLGNASAMEAALTWYRARGAIRAPLGMISAPVLYIWGDADDTVGRVAAEGTRDFVSGPYQFEILPGIGHFVVDQVAGRVNELLLAHLAKHPV